MKNMPSFAAVLILLTLFVCLSPALHAAPQATSKPSVNSPSGLFLRVSAPAENAVALRDPQSAEWEKLPLQRVALNRTPRLYETEAPSGSEIPFVEIRLVRFEGKLLVQMVWRDATQDSAQIANQPSAPTEERSHRELTEATDRFFDAAAVMHPSKLPENGVWPSVQMGEAGEPVQIYFWSAVRGAARMLAEGRGTTRRTNETFPAQAAYKQGAWHVTMELPDIPSGMPVALAIWNGSQQDRDGRKYFTTWLRLE